MYVFFFHFQSLTTTFHSPTNHETSWNGLPLKDSIAITITVTSDFCVDFDQPKVVRACMRSCEGVIAKSAWAVKCYRYAREKN